MTRTHSKASENVEISNRSLMFRAPGSGWSIRRAAVLCGVACLVSAIGPAAASNVQAQARTVTSTQTGRLTFVGVEAPGGGLPGLTAEVAQDSTPAGGLRAIGGFAAGFGLTDPAHELVYTGERLGLGGRTRALHYQQTYQGIPVVGGEMVASYDRLGRLAAITGEVSPELATVAPSTTPGITVQDAVASAVASVARATSLDPGTLAASAPELWIYDARLIGPDERPVELVWRLEVRSTEGAPVRFLVLVNATRGSVSLAFNQVDTSWSSSARPVLHARGEASSSAPRAAAEILASRHFTTPDMDTYDSHDSDARRGGVDSDAGAVTSTLVCSIPPGADPPALTGADSCDGGGVATPANAAHFFAFDTFAYYDVNHDRDSIDGAGMAIISNVEYTPTPPFANPTSYANAFWDGTQMTYGNKGFFAADDVVAHELTHGVTEHASNLFYYYESGAISEAMSDIFGELVDQANGIDSLGNPDDPADLWVIGEDVVAGGFRDMADPTVFGDPDRMQSPYYYAPGGVTYGYNGDFGGVHYNCGVANKAAYLMAAGGSFNGKTVAALGNAKTPAIFYETNTTLLTTGSDYGVLGAALVQACQNLVGGAEGITAADCTEVEKATLATEMELEPSAPGYSPDAAYACPNPAETPVDLFFDDFTSTAMQTGSTYPWAVISDYVTSLPYAAWGNDSAGTGIDSWLRTGAGTSLTGHQSYFLHFKQAFGFEDYLLMGDATAYDGGVVEYSTSGSGGPWSDVTAGGPSFVDGLAYNATIATGEGNPLDGRAAYGYDSHGWVSTRFDLTSLAGQTVFVRWRMGTDSFCCSDLGWLLDDVRIYACDSVVGCPYSATLDLSSQTVTTTETFGACDTLTAGSGFAVVSPGNVTFVAGNRIILDNGFSVGSGAVFTAQLDSALGP